MRLKPGTRPRAERILLDLKEYLAECYSLYGELFELLEEDDCSGRTAVKIDMNATRESLEFAGAFCRQNAVRNK